MRGGGGQGTLTVSLSLSLSPSLSLSLSLSLSPSPSPSPSPSLTWLDHVQPELLGDAAAEQVVELVPVAEDLLALLVLGRAHAVCAAGEAGTRDEIPEAVHSRVR